MSIGDLGINRGGDASVIAPNQQAIIDHLNSKSGVSWAFFPLAEGSGATLSDISGNVTDNLTLDQACNWAQQAAGEPDGCFNVNNANQASMLDHPAALTSLYSVMNTHDVGDGDWLFLFNIFTTSKTGSGIGTIMSYGNGNVIDNDPTLLLRILTGGDMQMNLDEGTSNIGATFGVANWEADAWNTFGLHLKAGTNNLYGNDTVTPATDSTMNMMTIDVPQTTSRGFAFACSGLGASAAFKLGLDTGLREVYLGGMFILKTNYSITSLIQPIVEGWYDQSNPFKLPQVLLQV